MACCVPACGPCGDGCWDVKCPVVRADPRPDGCFQPCPPCKTETCMMRIRPVPLCCGPQPFCQRIPCCNRLCCRPRWDASPPKPEPLLPPNYCFPCLPPVSCRYNRWICKSQKSQTDSNLWASRYSSCVENRCCNFVAVDPPAPFDCGEPCPCPCH